MPEIEPNVTAKHKNQSLLDPSPILILTLHHFKK